MQRSEPETRCKPSDQLADLARRIRRLCPDHRDPHRFHEEKSEIAYELSQLANRVV
ncbi:hypothetical protein [Pseudoprimorskyibacter insulae]|uniref:Uncharacterized protein n=1 Tax=Pseudoprimorskyibacter insulae TaxID=1695997 RepID=A0A2R8B0Y2_9RHOB|nr:hypothetical protein [Pseudoprimorskyibacter insulae]SPF81932.1 hypothetical protein PRI8871_03759 [Pseudoprimorskyibacter insulae]